MKLEEMNILYSITVLMNILIISPVVLLSIWSLQILCSRLFGGSLDSTGYLLVAKIWHVTHLNFTGEYTFLSLASSFCLHIFSVTYTCFCSTGSVSYFWHLMCSLLLSVLLWPVSLVLLFAVVFHV